MTRLSAVLLSAAMAAVLSSAPARAQSYDHFPTNAQEAQRGLTKAGQFFVNIRDSGTFSSQSPAVQFGYLMYFGQTRLPSLERFVNNPQARKNNPLFKNSKGIPSLAVQYMEDADNYTSVYGK